MDSSVVPRIDARDGERWGLAAAVLFHAVVVFLWWWSAIYSGADFPIGARVWLALAYAWLAWPISIAFRRRVNRRTGLALAVGATLLLSTAPWIFAFSVWLFRGFAP